VFAFWWIRIIFASAPVVHDAREVVGSITNVWVTNAIISGASVRAVIGHVLPFPPIWNILPVQVQVGSMTVVVPLSIWPFLFVVHAKCMPNFVHHVALVKHRIAPAKVYLQFGVPRKTQKVNVTGVRIVDSDFRVFIRRVCFFHEMNARNRINFHNGCSECLFPDVV
jgi:hypothetical protein